MVLQTRQFLLRNLIAKERLYQVSILSSLEADTESLWLNEDLLPVSKPIAYKADVPDSRLIKRLILFLGKYICEGDGITRNIKTPTPPAASPSPYSRPG